MGRVKTSERDSKGCRGCIAKPNSLPSVMGPCFCLMGNDVDVDVDVAGAVAAGTSTSAAASLLVPLFCLLPLLLRSSPSRGTEETTSTPGLRPETTRPSLAGPEEDADGTMGMEGVVEEKEIEEGWVWDASPDVAVTWTALTKGITSSVSSSSTSADPMRSVEEEDDDAADAAEEADRKEDDDVGATKADGPCRGSLLTARESGRVGTWSKRVGLMTTWLWRFCRSDRLGMWFELDVDADDTVAAAGAAAGAGAQENMASLIVIVRERCMFVTVTASTRLEDEGASTDQSTWTGLNTCTVAWADT